MKLLFCLAIFCASIPLCACDCQGERAEMEKLLEKSANVTVVKVMSVLEKADSIMNYKSERNDSNDGWIKKGFYVPARKVVLAVIENFKGDSMKTLTIVNEYTDCGIRFETGKTYLVFTSSTFRRNKISVNQCHSPCPEKGFLDFDKDVKEIKTLLKKKKG
jgi:hypothetical protein